MFDTKYICYCGLYCENCSVKARITPAAKTLYDEMCNAGFEEIINFIPGGDGFWPFLKSMATDGLCSSCKEGGGDPRCAIRLCAMEKGIELCALCKEYPCNQFDAFLQIYPALTTMKQDNALLREQGMDTWIRLQETRRASGYTYSDDQA